ncbi:MAG: CBS domain-containing protein, partial [Bacteroidetes bacterium]|nr:CBS domain-containing protein [Bacteroidota bacterium]
MDKHLEGKLTNKAALQKFTHHLLQDIKAVELMIANDQFEKGITRIGAEQEICLVNSAYRPAPLAQKLLAELKDDQITNELPKFNLEINLSPLEFKGNCLSRMEKELKEKLKKIYTVGK